MIDRFGRPVKGLRVSITERCNFNCFYCHKEGCPPSASEMTPSEIGSIIRVAADFGVEKVKITGGEPLVRGDVVDVVSAVSVPGIKDVSMTTNGAMLADIAHELAEAGLHRVNISLDTLDQANFSKITGDGSLSSVLAGVDAALEAGLNPVKLNMVVLAGVNDGEVERMIAYASERGAILQLIELIDLNGMEFSTYHKGLSGVEQKLRSMAVGINTRRSMQARKKYILPAGEVELVCPMHNTEFCSHCTRLRLTADGRLKPCLMRNDNLVDVISFVRKGDTDGVHEAFREAIARREPFFKAWTSAPV
ncbi:MAG: GTP 3',8-cyclase MoaA [Candidatus Hadarchaeota archaeon]